MNNEFETKTPENMFESVDLKILICYMLSSICEPIPATETAQLFHYEGIANYFDTQTALFELEKDGYIVAEKEKNMFSVTEKGVSLSATLKDTVSSVLRDRVCNTVLKMLSRYKAERDTDIEITKTDNGYLLTCKVTNNNEIMFSFQILMPDTLQATILKNKILEDPKYYYDSFIKILTENTP